MFGAPTIDILPGRHQPPHFDHLRLISRALELVPGEICLGLIVNPPLAGAPDTDFEREAREHQRPERAPFSFSLRRRLLDVALRERLDAHERARLYIVPLPRPEATFGLVTAIFPEARRWIVPQLGEDFDDRKAQFFAERGDAVLRVPLEAAVSGWTVRKLIQAEAWRELETHVPKSVIELLREERAQRS